MNDLKAILTIGGVVLAIMMFVPGVRNVLAFMFEKILWPAAETTFTNSGVWVLWAIKRLYSAHTNLLNNLLRSNSTIFPTLTPKQDDKE